jgi:hypothetical protein
VSRPAGQQPRREPERGGVEEAVAAGDAAGRVADRDQAGWVVRLPGPGAQSGADQLEVRRDHERAAVDQRRTAAAQEDQQAAEPQRTQQVLAGRERQAPDDPPAAQRDGGADDQLPVAVGEGAATDRQSSQVDQAVTRRHERRHVVQPVHVDPEPACEDVLDDAGVEHHDGHLEAGRRALAAQGHQQQQPGAGAEQALLGEAGAGVGQQHQQHPAGDGQHDPAVAQPPGRRHRTSLP